MSEFAPPVPFAQAFPGSLQLLFWIMVRPGAWRRFLHTIDPALRPDFYLAGLNPVQHRDARLRRLVMQMLIFLPCWGALVIAAVHWLRGSSGEQLVNGVAIGFTYALITSWALATTVNVAVGAIYGLALGIGMGVLPPESTSHIGIPLSIAAGLSGDVLVRLTGLDKERFFSRRMGPFLAATALLIALLVVAYVITTGKLIGDGHEPRVAAGISLWESILLGLVSTLVLGVVLAIVYYSRTWRWRPALHFGLTAGLVGGLGYIGLRGFGREDVALFVAAGLSGGVFYASALAASWRMGERLAGGWGGAVFVAIVNGLGWMPIAPYVVLDYQPLSYLTPVIVLALLLAFTVSWWMPVVAYPFLVIWNALVYQAEKQRLSRPQSLLRWHAAFWDETQYLPWIGLDEYLLLLVERYPVEGQRAMQVLATGRQRWAVQAVQIELIGRQLEACSNLSALGQACYLGLGVGLSGPISTLVRTFSQISQDVETALMQTSLYHTRLALSPLRDRLNSLERELMLTNETYAARFTPIAGRWRRIVDESMESMARLVESRQEIENPFICGTPLNEHQQVFVGRTDVLAQIEQLVLDPRRPPLLLYGQRRMGKTSLLLNLGRILPQRIIPLFVDCQGLAGLNNYAELLYGIAQQMRRFADRQRGLRLPNLTITKISQSPFLYFSEWLDEVEDTLLNQNCIGLLALDEFETLAELLQRSHFQAVDFLNLLRHLIQHRSGFKVLLSGSHTLAEYRNWASYLINTQVIKVTYLERNETLQLVERPVPGFLLRYDALASQHVLSLTRGHPHLVQLLCYELVLVKNDQLPPARFQVQHADVEAAVERALLSGSFFFTDLQNNQITPQGAAMLAWLARHGTGTCVSRNDFQQRFPEDFESHWQLLLQRDLIESVTGGFRFQVEMVRRWFAQNGMA